MVNDFRGIFNSCDFSDYNSGCNVYSDHFWHDQHRMSASGGCSSLLPLFPLWYHISWWNPSNIIKTTATLDTLAAMTDFACNKNRTRSSTTAVTLMANFQSQWKICKTTLDISVSDLTLVVIPNLIAGYRDIYRSIWILTKCWRGHWI